MPWRDNWMKNLSLILVGSMFAFGVISALYSEQEKTRAMLRQQNSEHVERSHAASIERQQLASSIQGVHEMLESQKSLGEQILVDLHKAQQSVEDKTTADRYTNTDATRDLTRLSHRIDMLYRDLYTRWGTTQPTTSPSDP